MNCRHWFLTRLGQEAARRLAFAPKTVRDWLRAGRLPGVKVGRLWRIREADLDAFVITARESTPPYSDADAEELSPDDLAALRRGLADVSAGRYVTLQEYDEGKRP